MIISALAKYYDCLAKMENSPLIPKGLSKVKISYVAIINDLGELKAFIPHTKTAINGKKTFEVPIEEFFPERVSTTKIEANIIEHRPKYLFGIEFEFNDKKFKITKKSRNSFEACKEKNIDFLSNIDCRIAKAMFNFFESWNPEENLDNFLFFGIAKDYNNSYFTFCLEDDNELINSDEQILNKFDEQNHSNKNENNDIMSQCAISGEYKKIARIHDNLKEIHGANSSGCNIVCFKNNAVESYGKENGYNASISEEIMKKYTQAFNILSGNKKNKCVLGNMTILFWAETSKHQEDYTDMFSIVCGLNNRDISDELSANIKRSFEILQKGKIPDISQIDLDESTKFYILGLTPNSSRLAIKMFLQNTFGEILKNVHQHIEDFQIYENMKVPSTHKILKELVSPKVDEKTPESTLVASYFNSIITGQLYPQSMLSRIIIRIKTDQDDKKINFLKINDTRVGIIKAYINRKNRILKKGEMITMSLNRDSREKGYLCGRLFAVLEILQKNAIGNVNSNIKSRFFGACCSNPAMVFPRLIKLAQNHIDKLEKSAYFEMIISEIIDKLDSNFPKTLSIEDQGKFIIGYYHQNKDIYTRKEKDCE